MLASYRSYFNTRYHSALLAETHIFTTSPAEQPGPQLSA
jgi:hypothetical protein